MHNFSQYELFIFDCDGVILDSNNLKIEAMRVSLERQITDKNKIDHCIKYFSENFGKSRFHHIEYFIKNILNLREENKNFMSKSILNDYSYFCQKLYLKANITPNFLDFIKSFKGKKFVASGSAQDELRNVFRKRELDQYFQGIFGSPSPKKDLIKNILKSEGKSDAVMIGDSYADYIAAKENNIDFIFYTPFSTMKEKMSALCDEKNIAVINTFSKMEQI